jgi:hypothetical protein
MKAGSGKDRPCLPCVAVGTPDKYDDKTVRCRNRHGWRRDFAKDATVGLIPSPCTVLDLLRLDFAIYAIISSKLLTVLSVLHNCFNLMRNNFEMVLDASK